MKTKCHICNWVGFCHKHHIIPLSDYGDDSKENIIMLCPNHHSEAHHNGINRTHSWIKFNKKHNLIGKYITDERKQILSKIGLLLKENRTDIETFEYLYLRLKYKISDIEAIAYITGMTVASVIKSYDCQDFNKYERERKEIENKSEKLLTELITNYSDLYEIYLQTNPKESVEAAINAGM